MTRRIHEVSGWATVVAFDPGGTTGWSVMAVNPNSLLNDKPLHKEIVHWVDGQITGDENEQLDEMVELVEAWPDAAIVVEDFVIRKFLQHRAFLSPVRLTAGLRWAVHDRGRDGGKRWIFTQTASVAMNTLTDDLQRRYKLWNVGAQHARDATKHCYTFLDRARQPKAQRMRSVAWPLLYRADGKRVLKKAPTPTKRSMY